MTDAPENVVLSALEPADLDGHTIDELADYLDAGMQPVDPSIDGSPACQNALAAIIRLRHASLTSLEAAARDEAPADDSWIGGVLANISLEARSGRDVPLRPEAATEHPVMTEGAIRSLVRRAGDTVPGIVIARCSIDGDVTELGAPVRVAVEVAIVAGPSIPATADLVRAAVASALREQTDLVVESIDVLVRDLIVGHPAPTDAADPDAADPDAADPDPDAADPDPDADPGPDPGPDPDAADAADPADTTGTTGEEGA